MKNLLWIIIFSLVIYGCTGNQSAKSWGGTQTITLEKGSRLVNITWKDASLWILTKKDTTTPTTYTFEERSNVGMFNGKLIIKEE